MKNILKFLPDIFIEINCKILDIKFGILYIPYDIEAIYIIRIYIKIFKWSIDKGIYYGLHTKKIHFK